MPLMKPTSPTQHILIIPCAQLYCYHKVISNISTYEARTIQFHIAPMQGYANMQVHKMLRLLSPSSIGQK